jgi:hypothetical protein
MVRFFIYSIFSALLLINCSTGNRQVSHSEMSKAPRYEWVNNQLVIHTQNSKLNSALSLYKITASVDTSAMVILLRGYQSVQSEYENRFVVELNPLPSDFHLYQVTWVDADGNQTNLKKVLSFKRENCKPYFSFDTIEHFKIEIEDSVFSYLSDKEFTTQSEKQLLDFIVDYDEGKLSDTVSLVINLEKFGFQKHLMPSSGFSIINNLFCEIENNDDRNIKMCIPYYRDILIFKKQNAIVGYAKICFSCQQEIIVGTNRNTSSFNSQETFEVLKEILAE